MSAELQDCPLGAGTDLKVYLDDFYFQDPSLKNDAELSLLHQRLLESLKTQLKTLSVENVVVRPVPCRGRQPEDGSEFDKDRAADLNARGVILDIWGILEAKKNGSQISERAGVVHVAIHSLRFYGFFSQSLQDVPGLYESRFPRSSGASPAGFLELVSQFTDLSAYAAIGIGLKKSRAGDADGAVAYLTRGEHELSLLLPQEPVEKANRDALLRYVQSVRCTTLRDTSTSAVLTADPKMAGIVGDCR